MNKNIKDTNVNAAANGETVRIRMSDFYPDYVGEQEYCEVSREFYEAFYAKKKKKQETVTVNVKELYPHLYHRIKFKTLTLPKDFYDELMEYRAVNDDVAIWVNDYYPYNKSEVKYVLVSREVYLQLIRDKNHESYVKRRNRETLAPFPYEDVECGEMDGIYSESNERNIELQLMLERLFAPYGEKYAEAAVRFFIDGEAPISIAASMGISKAVIWKMLRKIKEVVKSVGYEYFA